MFLSINRKIVFEIFWHNLNLHMKQIVSRNLYFFFILKKCSYVKDRFRLLDHCHISVAYYQFSYIYKYIYTIIKINFIDQNLLNYILRQQTLWEKEEYFPNMSLFYKDFINDFSSINLTANVKINIQIHSTLMLKSISLQAMILHTVLMYYL